jgi:hypothetical protein
MQAAPNTSQADAADRGAGQTWRAQWSPRVAGLVCGLAVFGWLVLSNRELLGSLIFDDGDAAANSILVEQAEQFRLLVGNYSRVGFNHPGPAFLYAQGFGDIVFHRLLGIVPGSYNGQFLGILALNSVCVGIACGVLSRVSGRWTSAMALVAVLPLIDVWEPHALATTWMPGAYIAPFLLLIVAAASVAGANWGHLWVLVVGASLCVHGHVSLVLFAGVTTMVAAGLGWLRGRRSGRRPRTADWLFAGAAAVIFVLPIAMNLLLHWPGEFEKYIEFATSHAGFTPRTTGDVLAFVSSYWTRGGWWVLLLVFAACAVALLARIADRADTGARFRLDVVAMCAIETMVFTFYAARGVDDLSFFYVGWFMLACPMLVLWAGLDGIVDVLGRRLARAGLVVAAAICGLLAAAGIYAGDSANPYRGMNPALAAALPSGPVRLQFSGSGWPAALGIVVQALRTGQDICVLGEEWTILASAPLICSDDNNDRIVRVLGPDEARQGLVIYDDGANALLAG